MSYQAASDALVLSSLAVDVVFQCCSVATNGKKTRRELIERLQELKGYESKLDTLLQEIVGGMTKDLISRINAISSTAVMVWGTASDRTLFGATEAVRKVDQWLQQSIHIIESNLPRQLAADAMFKIETELGVRQDVQEKLNWLQLNLDVEREAVESLDDNDDGPQIGNAWNFSGHRFEGMEPTAWRLCNYLWSQRYRTSSYDSEFSDAVFRDREIDCYSERVGSHRKAANKFFNKHNIPVKVSAFKDHAKLEKKSTLP